jgi:hypothetical protein
MRRLDTRLSERLKPPFARLGGAHWALLVGRRQNSWVIVGQEIGAVGGCCGAPSIPREREAMGAC